MIAPIGSALHALGSAASVGSVGSVGSTAATGSASATSPTSFGSELTSALSNLEQTQNTASTAAQGLASGTISDPTTAVTAVENASLAMDIASQIQNKLITDETTLFNTQF